MMFTSLRERHAARIKLVLGAVASMVVIALIVAAAVGLGLIRELLR